MFSGKNGVKKIFSDYYYRMLAVAEKSPLSHNAEFEIIPAIYIVMDYAAANAGNDRESVLDAVLQDFPVLDKKDFKEIFDRRCELYGAVIRGKELRCEWFMGDREVFNNNAVSRCTALLGDFLYNPACAVDYDSAPAFIYGIDKCLSFTVNVMNPILHTLTELFLEIYNL